MHETGVFIATLLGATVEWVEAFTIVLAVALSYGWRLAMGAAATAMGALGLLTVTVGQALTLGRDLPWLRLVIGGFLLLFGLRWLAKAVARHAGLKSLHDESAEFRQARATLDGAERKAAWLISFKGVFLEGIEVWLIVVTLGYQTGNTFPAVIAALMALIIVMTFGLAVRAPLTRVPENALKFGVGAMILSFGTFWMGEALGGPNIWGLGDLSLLVLLMIYLAGGWLIAEL